MAVLTNTFLTYAAVGNREDLIDVITNIDPVETFFTSNSGTARAKGRLHEWLDDSLVAAGANSQIEGDDFAATAVTAAARRGNYCQILRRGFILSDTQEAVDKAGRDSEVAYQTQKTMKELANDIEYALVVSSATASGASATARTMMGAEGFITDNVITGSGTGNENLTEDMVNDLLELVWADGGRPTVVLCGAFQKRRFAEAFYTTSRLSNADAPAATFYSNVEVYEGPFGRLAVKPHQIINAAIPGKLLMLDMTLWYKAWLRPVKMERLARSGAATKVMVEAELTLESRQQQGSGKITELTTS